VPRPESAAGTRPVRVPRLIRYGCAGDLR
jgi:hypothetical protein